MGTDGRSRRGQSALDAVTGSLSRGRRPVAFPGAAVHRKWTDGGWFVAMALVILLAACGSPTSTKYTQTWTKSYNTTTCSDWRDAMDEHQKFVMAADILYSSQKKVKPNVPLPDDALVGQF